MSLLSPIEDFQSRSVARLGGVFEKLRFVAGLRDAGKHYSHWGMETTHGKEAAGTALAAVHTIVWVDLMRRKIRELEQDVVRAVQDLKPLKNDKNIVPANTSGTTARHFHYLVEAVTLLRKSSRRAA